MTDSPLFKRAFARGLCSELTRSGEVAFPSKEASDYAADYVADNSGMPEPTTQGDELDLKIAHDLCVQIKQASDALCEQAGGYSPLLSKTAAEADPYEVAANEALAVMQKVASEVGTEKGTSASTMPEDKMTSGESTPPQGKGPAIEGGQIGSEKPVSPNTVPEDKMSSGESASDTAGPAPVTSNPTGSTEEKGETRTTPEDKMTSGEKTAALQKTASLVVPFLLRDMTDREKVAHVNALHPLSPSGKAKYLEKMYEAYGVEKSAAVATAAKFRKLAEDDADETEADAVARAMEEAAEDIEKIPDAEMAPPPEEEPAADAADAASAADEKKEAAFSRLRTAAQRIASR